MLDGLRGEESIAALWRRYADRRSPTLNLKGGKGVAMERQEMAGVGCDYETSDVVAEAAQALAKGMTDQPPNASPDVITTTNTRKPN